MLGHWRIALRQAEESARAGRFEEALALASRPDVADHRHAIQLRGRLAVDLVGRANRRASFDDLDGAIADLKLAERFGAAPDLLAAARHHLADRVAEEVRADLEAGEPARVLERVDHLAKNQVGGPALRRAREAAEAWQAALDEARRGEFGRARDQLDRAERLAGSAAEAALAGTRREIEGRQQAASPKVERLYAALAAGQWGETLAAAESLLEAVPDHPAARQARQRAWQQIGGINPAAALPARAERAGWSPPEADDAGPKDPPIIFLDSQNKKVEPPPIWTEALTPRRPRPAPMPAAAPPSSRPPRENPGPKGRCLLWADAVGGYLVCLDDEISLGRAGADASADVPLLGDIARRHATLVRDGDSYVIKAHQPTFVNGRRVESAPLRSGDVIRLGSSVELEFRQPSPVSSTARLAFLSRHRLPLAVEGVILMAETCILGPTPQAHVPASSLEAPVVLYRQGADLWCRAAGEFEVDGQARVGRSPLTLRSSVLGDGFSFSLEELPARTGTV